MANDILSVFKRSLNLNTLPNTGRSGWFPIIKESFTGAWQQNVELTKEDILSYHAIYACITLIAGDISKLGLSLVRKDENGIWTETENPAYSPVLRKPNNFQTRIQFFENWVISILKSGNAYILKGRDNRRVVTSLHVLDPNNVTVLVSPNGEVWYDLQPDPINEIQEPIRIPASEIIHDRMNTLYHPLVGISPIYACAMPVLQGIEIQKNSSSFFRNNSRPGGILTTPGAVSDETVAQLRAYWEDNYTGNNAGKVAVLADGLTYKSFDMATAQNSQVVEQLNWTAEVVCSVFHVPTYMINVGSPPTSNNVQALNQQYYMQALQSRIEHMELCLDEGLGMSGRQTGDLGVEFNINSLLRMDTSSLVTSEKEAVSAGIKSPNESRKNLNLGPVKGGESPMIQQQNYSLAALAKRDAKEDPFAKEGTTVASTNEDTTTERFTTELRIKSAGRFIHA